MTSNIRVLTHSSIRVEGQKTVVYIDPFEIDGAPHDADVVFVTHSHYDHFSPEDIEKISKANTILVAPNSMNGETKKAGGLVSKIINVTPGEEPEILGVKFQVVRAYNTTSQFHKKEADFVGYIINVDGSRIYIAGDTEANEDNLKVQCDVALVPIGGTYTMDAKAAADFVNRLNPKVAIPTHYGNIVGDASAAEEFAKKVNPGIKVEIKMEK
ncbi:MAG: MBL fold metallo-hydrolase [Lachnospiraceae bacterium]|nr:MBL fold metallo-hydrolase [Lachnospiraceae bacterium]